MNQTTQNLACINKLGYLSEPRDIYSGDYYLHEGLQFLCHEIKKNEAHTLLKIAQQLVALIPNNTTIIPIPSHKGYATYTLTLAYLISELNPSIIVDNRLVGKHREKLYDLKINNEQINNQFFEFKDISKKPLINPYLLDNVYDTGTTIKAARKALNNESIPYVVLAKVITPKLNILYNNIIHIFD